MIVVDLAAVRNAPRHRRPVAVDGESRATCTEDEFCPSCLPVRYAGLHAKHRAV